MPFTTPPDFENNEGWSSYKQKYVVLEPQSKQMQLATKFGVQDAWDCIVWELVKDHLEPHTGVRIFNPKLVNSLDLAYRQGAPLAGFVTSGGRNDAATVIINDGSPTMALLEKLYNDGNPITESPAGAGANKAGTDEESF